MMQLDEWRVLLTGIFVNGCYIRCENQMVAERFVTDDESDPHSALLVLIVF